MAPIRTAVLVGLTLAVAACGATSSTDSVGGPATAVSVAEALQREGQKVRVRGALVVDRREARLCDGLAESYPPQCVGGARLVGFDASARPPEAGESRGVRWLDSVEVIAVVRDGTLHQVVLSKTE